MTIALITEGMLGSGGGGGDANPPVATAISPTPNTTPGASGGMPADYPSASATPIVVDITDLDGADDLAIVIVTAMYLGGGSETVYRAGAFTPAFATSSTETSITDGIELSIDRTGGWPGAKSGTSNLAVTIQIDASDMGGNVISTPFAYEMPLVPAQPTPAPTPVVSPYLPNSPQFVDQVATGLGRLIMQFQTSSDMNS